jgi:hypothetical protein
MFPEYGSIIDTISNAPAKRNAAAGFADRFELLAARGRRTFGIARRLPTPLRSASCLPNIHLNRLASLTLNFTFFGYFWGYLSVYAASTRLFKAPHSSFYFCKACRR